MGPRWKRRDGRADVTPQRFDPFDLVVLACGAATQVLTTCTNIAGGVEALARGHANWRADRRELAEQVHNTIDRL